MGAKSNCARPEGEREMVVTGKREKWTVMGGELGSEALTLAMMAVVRGSRAVFEEGTRMPSRIPLGGVLDWRTDRIEGFILDVAILLVCFSIPRKKQKIVKLQSK